MTVEKRLKDYKGFEVWKIIDNIGTSKKVVTYMLNDTDGNNIDCFSTLKELKQFVDIFCWYLQIKPHADLPARRGERKNNGN